MADQAPADSSGKPDNTTTAKPGVDDDPTVVEAKRRLELAKVAMEQGRLGLNDQAERSKLIKELIPDFGAVTVEKSTSTAAAAPSGISESVIQYALSYIVDDIANLVLTAPDQKDPADRAENHDENADGGSESPGVASGTDRAGRGTFVVTSDQAYLSDLAARRDVEMSLARIKAAIDREVPKPPTDTEGSSEQKQGPVLQQVIGAATLAKIAVQALPGAITLATKLLAHQYTTSSYTSTLTGAVDIGVAGAIAHLRPAARVLIYRMQPPLDPHLEGRLNNLATELDGRLADALRRAMIEAAHAERERERLTTRRETLDRRAASLYTAIAARAGDAATPAGLAADIALICALDDAIEKVTTDEDKKPWIRARDAARARVDAVVKDGPPGLDDLVGMVAAMDQEAAAVAAQESDAQLRVSEADQKVDRIRTAHAAGIDLLDSLGSADPSNDRLIDKAARAAPLMDNSGSCRVVYVRLHHAAADTSDDEHVGSDHRNVVAAASVEWALLEPGGDVVRAGVRTLRSYLRADKFEVDEPEGLLGHINLPAEYRVHP